MSLTDQQELVLCAIVAESMSYGQGSPVSVATIHRHCLVMRPVFLAPEESEVEDLLVTLQHAGMVESCDGGWLVTERGFDEEAS